MDMHTIANVPGSLRNLIELADAEDFGRKRRIITSQIDALERQIGERLGRDDLVRITTLNDLGHSAQELFDGAPYLRYQVRFRGLSDNAAYVVDVRQRKISADEWTYLHTCSQLVLSTEEDGTEQLSAAIGGYRDHLHWLQFRRHPSSQAA